MEITKQHKLIINLSYEAAQFVKRGDGDTYRYSYDYDDYVLDGEFESMIHEKLDDLYKHPFDIQIKIIETEPLTVKVKFKTNVVTFTKEY